MTLAIRRDWALVFILALAARVVFALPQAQPGYMDACYYTVGAQQLAAGRGFTEPFIWNYLDDPAGLPRPSHQYWMPLPSILAALSMRIAGHQLSAQLRSHLPVLSALLAVIAYGIAWQTSASRRHAWAAAVLAIFSGFLYGLLVRAGDVRAVCRVRVAEPVDVEPRARADAGAWSRAHARDWLT